MRVLERWFDGLSTRDLRALRIGGGLLVAMLAWKYAVVPYGAELTDRKRKLTEQKRLLGAEARLLASEDYYRSATRRAAAKFRYGLERLLSSGDPGLAAAELAEIVEVRARKSRVLIKRSAPGAVDRLDRHVSSVSLEVRGESDLEGILTFLQSLQNGEKVLRTAALRIETESARPGSTLDGMEVLSFVVTVKGFLYSEAPGAEATVSERGVGE